MKQCLRPLATACAVVIIFQTASSQCNPPPAINWQNPSFEGTFPAAGITPAPWTECLAGQTPDTQPGAWGVNLPPTNGSSYLGLVAQTSAGWIEGASEPLSSPMVSGTQYTFTVDLANSSINQGPSIGILPGCAELVIWGGFSACDQNTLLWSSGNITPFDTWITNTVTFTPAQNFTWLFLQINSLGCTDGPYILVDNLTTIQPSAVNPNIMLNNNVSCFGGTNGLATAHVIGQNPPFTYSWNSAPVQTDSVLDNVPAGTYTVTVTNMLGCTGTATVNITQPAQLVLTPTVINATCGANNGSAYMSYAGGVAPYVFNWSNGVVGQPNGNLFAGIYGLTVTDANLCTATASVTISSANGPNITAVVTNTICGGNTGQIATNVTSGTPGYLYVWNTVPVQNGATATGLSAGNYIVTVTDAVGCSSSATYTVTGGGSGLTVTTTPTPVPCFGQSTGSISTTVTGGTPVFTYVWNTIPVQNTPIAIGLPAGTYTVTVTDASGCNAIANATITQPPSALSATIVETDVLCFGMSTGSSTVTPAGGTAGYTYSWNTVPVQTGLTANNLAAGNYTVTVTDAHNCTFSINTTVNQPAAALTETLSQVDVLCFGQNTGSATIAAAGGTTNYSYTWNSIPVQNTATASNLGAGTYHITVTDAHNCTVSGSVTINQPAAALTGTIAKVDVLCFGDATGSATLTASGGTGAYSYSWNTVPVQNTATASNLVAGTYTVTVTDANGCTFSASAIIAQPAAALTVNIATVDVLCFGLSTGRATATAAGGTTAYSYSWNTVPVQNTAVANNIPAGTYTVTVTDAHNCTIAANAVINQPASALAGNLTQVNVLCFGQNTGSATINVNGGTPVYNYTWNSAPVQHAATALNLTTGTYNVTVTDANNCTITDVVTITQPTAALSGVINKVDVLCFGDATGSATYTVNGGTLGYTYNWNTVPVQNTATSSNLTAGTYNVTVTDANNCTISTTTTINQPAAALTAILTQADVLCFGMSTGRATVTAAGGTLGYTYSWNTVPVQTTAAANNLPAGTYTVTVTDANNCTATASAIIGQPASALAGNLTQVDVLCFGMNTGSASITVNGGTLAYGYVWNSAPIQNTATASNLTAGIYRLTVTDANGCTITATTTINQPAAPLAGVMNKTDVLCFGDATGNATYTVSGGTPAYNYSWNTVPVQTTPTASNLTAGTYDITVTDANSCTISATTTINQPASALNGTITHTDILCFGMSTGSVNINVFGGTPGYTYNWNTVPVQTTAAISNVVAGTYDVTVTDANSCTFTGTATVTQPAAALAETVTKVDVLCFGMSTGSATVNANGGTTAYSYLWNTAPVQTTPTASNLVAGNYSITVTDANGCTVVGNTTITEPAAPLTVTITMTAPLCFGQPAATATATAAGGTVGYNYTWNTVPVQNTSTANNLAPGTYGVTVTDANACTVTQSVTIAPAPTPITVVMSHVDVLCFGDATGSVTVTATGSFGSYSYNWNTAPIQITPTASALTSGTYNVTVTDIQGCSATGTDVISQPAAPLTLATNKTDVLCFGDATGSATVVANGGTTNYTYVWSSAPIQTTSTAANIPSGTYTITVTDAHNCTATASAIIVQPAAPLAAVSNAIDINCFGANNGSISITASGGTTAYSYNWSAVPNINSPNVSNLQIGNYSVTVTDANSCTFVISNMVITQPAVITISPLITNVSCPGFSDGSIDAIPGGGVGPYTFSWNNTGSTELIANLPGGSYTVTVTDNNGCTLSNTTPIIELPGISLLPGIRNVLCFPLRNGEINLTASTSFPPLQYLWSNGLTAPTIASLDTGTYSVTLTDSHGCVVDSTFHIGNDNIYSINTTPTDVTINLGQSVDISVTPNGSTFGSILWQPATGLSCNDCATPNASPIQTITYNVYTIDTNGCIANDLVHVTVIPNYVVFIPNVFTPNGDGFNDFFEIFGNKEAWKQFDVQVYDRWGEKVFESGDMNFKWNGTYKGKDLNPQVLIYEAHVVYLDNYTDKLFKGSVTLLK